LFQSKVGRPVYRGRGENQPWKKSLRPALQAIGDRLEKPGNERIRLIGSLVRSDEAQSRPVQITSEFSGRLRLEEQTSETARVLTFNEDGVGVTNGAPEQLDRAVIETLVYDSPEHFFIGQMGAAATRFPDDGEAENYAGPFYDIYQTTEQVRIGLEAREQTKLYYFNSDTRLLERVLYTLSHDGSESSVEIQLSDWREIEGQKVPGRIIRLENNAPMLTFSLTPSSIGSRAEDGIFKTEQ
jgi:hypothetical protein